MKRALIGLLLLVLVVLVWQILYVPTEKNGPKVVPPVENVSQEVKRTLYDNKSEHLGANILTESENKPNASSVDASEKVMGCIINRTRDFETDLEPCGEIRELKYKKLDHIKNLIISQPFELIEKGISHYNDFGEEVTAPFTIHVQKIGYSTLGDIYILNDYQYAFPELEYSYHRELNEFETRIDNMEIINIYLGDDVKEYKVAFGSSVSINQNLPICSESSIDNVGVVNTQFFIQKKACREQEPVFRLNNEIIGIDEKELEINNEVVDFVDMAFQKCVKTNLGLDTNAVVKQFHLNGLFVARYVPYKRLVYF